jgi:hypothetical protein
MTGKIAAVHCDITITMTLEELACLDHVLKYERAAVVRNATTPDFPESRLEETLSRIQRVTAVLTRTVSHESLLLVERSAKL